MVAHMRILGIDPGSHTIGYGLIVYDSGRYTAESFGTIQVPPKTPQPITLASIYTDMTELLAQIQPDVMVVEQLFFFKNVMSPSAISFVFN